MVSVFMEQLTVTAGGFYGSKYSSGVIAKYYLDALANLGVCPRLLRCDSGMKMQSFPCSNLSLDIMT